MSSPRALTSLWSSSISGQAGLLDFLAERGVGRVEVPGVCPGVTFISSHGISLRYRPVIKVKSDNCWFMFPDERLHRDHSASQGQVSEVDSRGSPDGRDSGPQAGRSRFPLRREEGVGFVRVTEFKARSTWPDVSRAQGALPTARVFFDPRTVREARDGQRGVKAQVQPSSGSAQGPSRRVTCVRCTPLSNLPWAWQ